MEESASIRRRTTRHTRESTPEPSRKVRTSKSSDREIKTIAKDEDDEMLIAKYVDAKYVVRGILNVGPPSPAGSISSSSSGSGGHVSSNSGSHAYRAKLLRYLSPMTKEFVFATPIILEHNLKFHAISIFVFISQIKQQKGEKYSTGSSPESINLPAIGVVSDE